LIIARETFGRIASDDPVRQNGREVAE